MTFTNTLYTFITWDVNPDAFELPFLNFPVRWYGLLFALSFLLGQQVMYFIYKKEGRSSGEVDTLTIYVALATVIGARLGHVLFYDPVYYFHNPSKIIATWEGGLASHGAGIGLFIALYLFARKTKVPYLWILDRMTIIVASTGCLIRLGNLMNSEMVGVPTTMPWGFVFVLVDDVPRHPSQLYESICCFFLFIGLFWAWHKLRDRMANGFLFGWFLTILFSFRFIDEFFKINQESFEDGMILNMGQLLSIPFILAGIIILFLNKKKNQETIKI